MGGPTWVVTGIKPLVNDQLSGVTHDPVIRPLTQPQCKTSAKSMLSDAFKIPASTVAPSIDNSITNSARALIPHLASEISIRDRPIISLNVVLIWT